MDDNLINVENLKPFPKFFYTLGMLPTSFRITMTYEEQVLEIMRFIKDEIIPNVNQNILATKELQEKFVELVNYVNEYFENLDLQEEVNNKLDEMVEDGSFAEIVSQYLDTKLSIYDNIEAMKENTRVGEIFKLKNYDTTFITTENETISSLKINDNLYADVISKSVIIDSLGINSNNIDTSLFEEIVEYVRNKGIEIIFDHKTYNLTGTINLTTANKLKLSGLGYDSVINYTGNDYAFIINRFQQGQMYNFTINCVNNGGGLYFKYLEGEEQTNLLNSCDFKRVYIYNSKNPLKSDCHCGYINFEECVFEVGTTDGVGIDFRNAYYPEFINIERCAIRTKYRSTQNTSYGIYFTSGIMLDIKNNDIIGFNIGFCLDASESDEVIRTINILENSFWDSASKAIYCLAKSNNRIHNLAIKNSTITNSQRQTTLPNAMQLSNIDSLTIDNISIMQPSTSQLFISDGHHGVIQSIFSVSNPIQSNNQIGDDLTYHYTNWHKYYNIPANSSLDIEIGNAKNLINFKQYSIIKQGLGDTTGLSISNITNSGGKVNATITNSTSSNIGVIVIGY